MASNNPGSASASRTFADTIDTTVTTVVPSIITQSDQIALYFSEDLEELVHLTGIDLAETFQIPLDYFHDPKDIITLLYEDIAHMLRDGLITGIHLIFSDSVMDKGTNAYLVRYHVHYLVNNPNNMFAAPSPAQRFGGMIAPPRNVWRDARFALLIDWNPSARDRRHRVRRPNYCFDWVAEEDRFDATNVICYREGQMAVDSATVIRKEATPLEHHQGII